MLKQRHEESILFDGEDYLFKKYLMNCDYYFEYGVGASTRWVLAVSYTHLRAHET